MIVIAVIKSIFINIYARLFIMMVPQAEQSGDLSLEIKQSCQKFLRKIWQNVLIHIIKAMILIYVALFFF